MLKKNVTAKSVSAAAGAWTDIVDIRYPSGANPGDLVNITVHVKNLATYGIYIAVTGKYDNTAIGFAPDYAAVGPGATYVFTGSFTMPNKSVQVSIWTFYWGAEAWRQDDYELVNVALIGAPQEGIVEIVSVNSYPVR